MSVPEIGGQNGQTAANIFPGAMPVQQRLDCETMTEVMQPWAAAGRSAANTNLSGEHIKYSTDLPWVEPSVITRAKEVGFFRATNKRFRCAL